ncbi:MAG: hypothetical protein ACOX2O_01695 [Bdellovibrionota bacterium]
MKKELFISFLLMALTSCGGGGGDDAAQNSSMFNIDGVGRDRVAAGVRVVHGVIDGYPLQISDETGVLYAPLRYSFTNYLELSKKVQNINLEKYKTNEPVAFFSLDLSKQARSSVLFCGSRENRTLKTNFVTHQSAAVDIVSFRVLHLLYGAGFLKTVVNGVEMNADFCNASQYLSFSDSVLNVTISRLSDGRLIMQDTINVQFGKSYSLIVSGDLEQDFKVKLAED